MRKLTIFEEFVRRYRKLILRLCLNGIEPWFFFIKIFQIFLIVAGDAVRSAGRYRISFWSCSKIEGFWREVQRITQKFCEDEIPEDPALFLLHDFKISVKKYKESIVCHLLNAAKVCIPLTQKQTTPIRGILA